MGWNNLTLGRIEMYEVLSNFLESEHKTCGGMHEVAGMKESDELLTLLTEAKTAINTIHKRLKSYKSRKLNGGPLFPNNWGEAKTRLG